MLTLLEKKGDFLTKGRIMAGNEPNNLLFHGV